MNHNKPIIQQQEEPSFTSFNVQALPSLTIILVANQGMQMTSSLFSSKRKAKYQ